MARTIRIGIVEFIGKFTEKDRRISVLKIKNRNKNKNCGWGK
jgi:hypothetical protein